MKTGKNTTEEQESNFLAKILFRYAPYWPLFLLLMIVSMAGSWLYLHYTTPYYEATARILIKDEKKGTEDAKAVEDLNLLSTKKIVENEMEVIQSRSLLNEVVKKLHLYAPVFEKGRIRNASAYVTSPVTIELKNPDSLNEKNKIPFVYNAEKKLVELNGKSYPLNQWTNSEYGLIKFIPNTHLDRHTGTPLYFSLASVKNISSQIQSRLKVTSSSKQSSIINLSLLDEVPERGQDILNQLLDAYNEATLNDKNTLAQNTMSFVEDRLKTVEEDLAKIQRRDQQYKSSTGAVDIGEQGRLFLQNVSDNDQKLGDINMKLAVLGQVENYVLSKNGAGGLVPSTVGVADPVLGQLVGKLYTTELEYESLKKTTAENNPSMLALEDQIQKIKPGILENVQSQRRGLEASRNNLAATNSSYTSLLRSIPEKERALIEINREQSIKNGIYSFLLQKREETALTHASNVSDSRVIDRAESTSSPVTPKSKVIYLSAFLIALLGGVGAVAAKEGFSRKIMFRHEIEQLTTQPIIGEIISEKFDSPIVIGADTKTFIAEQFRKLRATLKFIGINSKKKRIMVTSAIAGEGKSFVATNLALSLALTGKRVILVDCDLNNPSLHKKLNIENKKGVTDYLLGECEPEEIIMKTDLDANLFIMTTGQLPYNPSELIMNGEIEHLLNYLDSMFDYIVVDTAPVSPVTDAYIVSPFIDATLFVIRHKYTPKVFVQRMDENNKLNKLNNLAIVFNGVLSRGFGSKKYGYGYGYGYIYNDGERQVRIGNT